MERAAAPPARGPGLALDARAAAAAGAAPRQGARHRPELRGRTWPRPAPRAPSTRCGSTSSAPAWSARGEAIEIPRVSEQVDYEGELAMVIGRRCRHIPAADAASVVAGFTVVNDVTVRDWQWRTPTWTLGKSFDTHGPTGPWIVTGDEIGDPHRLRLRTWVNDELRQDALHRRHDLLVLGAGRVPVHGVHPRARRHRLDGDPGRGRHQLRPAPLAGGRRRRPDRHRGRRDPREPRCRRARP